MRTSARRRRPTYDAEKARGGAGAAPFASAARGVRHRRWGWTRGATICARCALAVAAGTCARDLLRMRGGRYRCSAASLVGGVTITLLLTVFLSYGVDDSGAGVRGPGGLRNRRRFGFGGTRHFFIQEHGWKSTRRSLDDEPVPVLIPGIRSSGKFPPLPEADIEEWEKEYRYSDEDYEEDFIIPFYDGLDMYWLEDGEARNILRDDWARSGHVYSSTDFEDENDDWVDPYYAFDDDVVRHPSCRRVLWQRFTKPNCNEFHSFELLGRKNKYISHGYFRDVFILEDGAGEDSVLKSIRLKPKDSKVRRSSMENTRMDALIMERLSASPRVVDIYGHCGTSVFTEALPVDVHKLIEPTDGFAKQEDLEDDEDFGPMNDLNPTKKLALALEMAEGLAELHGFEGGVIVHDDVQLQQFLRAKDGTLKINDFNRAEVMLWDEKKKEYCRYKNGGGYGNYRAPEEWVDDPLNEQIDVYSFGNNVYGLLTGLEPFYTNEDDEVVHEKMESGEVPFIDERYRKKRSFAEAKLTELLDKCWRQNPDDRINIFEVVSFLRNAVDENAQREASAEKNTKKKNGKKKKKAAAT